MDDDVFLSEMSLQVITSFLDPRFKTLSFLKTPELRFSVHQTVLDELRQIEFTPHESSADVAPKVSKLCLLLGEDSGEHMKKLPNGPDEEIKYYNELEKIPANEDPLKWWKIHSSEIPGLAKLARRYLQTPATSASSERAFSSFGNIFTAKRMQLASETAEAILFLHINNM